MNSGGGHEYPQLPSMVLVRGIICLSLTLTHCYSVASLSSLPKPTHIEGRKAMGHSIGDPAHDLGSGLFQAWQVRQKTTLIANTANLQLSLFPIVGHRSSTDQSIWGSGHSPDLDGEILPTLNA
jgi:hypothetical protein